MTHWYTDLKHIAKWIWHAQPATHPRQDMALFHGILTPPPRTATVELHVSADNRYILYANRNPVPLGRGPARSDIYHYALDPYGIDLRNEPPLKPLHLFAHVRWFVGPPESPLPEMHSVTPGFLLIALFHDANGKCIGKAGTNKSWQVCPAQPITPITPGPFPGYLCVGHLERHDAGAWPVEWLNPDAFGPSSADRWQPALERGDPYFKPDPDAPWGPGESAWLLPRQIAHPYETPREFQNVYQRRADGSLSPLTLPLTVPQGERVAVVADVGENILAYPCATLEGSAETTVKYAEVLFTGEEVAGASGGSITGKSFDLATGAPLHGYADQWHNAGPLHTFSPFHWRSFRFLELTIAAAAGPATLHQLALRETGYPFENQYTFTAQDQDQSLRDTIAKMVHVSWRTLQSCTWETYMDCPYYEQLQYVGDTRLQVLCTYVATGDPTLPAQTLRAFDRSRIDEGITQSRYPSAARQLIPTFSLIYILMIDDWLTHVGEEGLVAELRPGIAPILNWFTRYTDPRSGLIGTFPYWPFVDWVAGWDKGIPPGPVSSIINMQYVMALDAAARIYEQAKPGSGELYANRATLFRDKIRDQFFDETAGLIADTPVRNTHGARTADAGHRSQHAQALATLSGVFTRAEARHALRIAMDPARLAPAGPKTRTPNEARAARQSAIGNRPSEILLSPCSFYFRFYLAKALAAAGMGDQLWPLLEPFRDALARGSTTWPEAFEPSRSECHAWGAWPIYFFARHVLGVAPPDADDQRITVRPIHCPPLHRVAGTVVTSRGPVQVSVDWTQGAKPHVEADGPNVHIATDPSPA